MYVSFAFILLFWTSRVNYLLVRICLYQQLHDNSVFSRLLAVASSIDNCCPIETKGRLK